VADTPLPEPCLTETTVAGPLHTRLSQAHLLPKECAQRLHVVIIVKTHLRPQAQAPGLLCSSDLPLAYVSLVDYEGWRCHIALNFRAAQQDWGLEDVMNGTPRGGTNAANRSLFMVNVAYRLQGDRRQYDPDYRILDWKAACRGDKYVAEMRQMLPEKPEPIVLRQMLNKVAC
jgi:putative transposase